MKKCTIRLPMALNRIQKAKGKVREGVGLVKKQGIAKFTKEVCQYCFWESIGHSLPLAIRRFKARVEKIENINVAIDFAFDFNYAGLS
jgi:hypothetical protein